MTKRLPKGMSITPFERQIVSRLYDTNIVVFTHAHNEFKPKIQLNTNGWRTKHTKKCINLFFTKYSIPLYVCQEKYVWYVYNSNTGSKVEFTDNISLDLD
jgi:hypothetical protein